MYNLYSLASLNVTDQGRAIIQQVAYSPGCALGSKWSLQMPSDMTTVTGMPSHQSRVAR